MIKKRAFNLLLIILLLVLFIIYPVLAGGILPQKGTPMGDLTSVDTYKGTSRLLLKMFVGCLRLEEEVYVSAIPNYVQMLYLDALEKDLINAKDSPVFYNTWYNKPGMYLVPKLELDWETPPQSFIYEGDCKLFINYQHEYWKNGEQVTTEDDEPLWSLKDEEVYKSTDATFTDGNDADHWGKELNGVSSISIMQLTPEYGLNYEPWSTSYFVDNSDYKYSVSWEDNKNACENFGGKYGDVNPKCCGDDYLWIMNGVYNFDGTSEDKSVDELCLYGYVGEDGEPIIKASESSAKVGNHPYRKGIYCTPLPTLVSDIHYSYDINNYDPLSTTETRKLFVYDKNNPLTATDVGLWKIDTKPYYCMHYFNDKGDNFEWLKSQEAGEINYFGVGNSGSTAFDKDNKPYVTNKKFTLNQKAPDYIYDVMTKQLSGDNYKDSDDFTICNLFLNGIWTGHHCCGNKYNGVEKILENFNDEGEDGTHYVLSKNRLSSYAISAETSDEVWKEPNKACYQGEAIESGEILNSQLNLDVDSIKEIIFLDSSENKIYCLKSQNAASDEILYPLNSNNYEKAKLCCQHNYGQDYKYVTYHKEEEYDIGQYFNFYFCSNKVIEESSSVFNKKGTLKLCINKNEFNDNLKESLGKTYNFQDFSKSSDYLFPSKDDANVVNSCSSFYFKSGEDFVSVASVNENNRFAYCFTNNTWLSFDISPEEYEPGTNPEFDILGRYPTEGEGLVERKISDAFEKSEYLKKKLKLNSAQAHDTGCCFQDDCWNGLKCVTNGKTEIDTSQDPKKVYLCANGEWTSGEPTYNWYQEDFGGEVDPSQTGLQYCVDKWACACPEKDAYDLGDEDQHEIDICETYTKPESLCTREPAMFIGDRFCEPKYTNKDKTDKVIGYNFDKPETIISSQWTSRTKYLATALLQLASKKNSPDFVLQCDTPKNVLNFYDLNFAKDLFVTELDYNNFCALKLKTTDGDEEVYLGTTLNPQLNYEEIPEELYKTQTISEFEQCTDDTSCLEGYGCYKKSAANTGQCVKQCYGDNDCEEEEECFTAEEVPEGELNIGLCAPTSVKDVDMFNIENLGELFYGDSDTSGILDNKFLFSLVTQQLAETDCKTEISLTNPKNNEEYLIFKTCKEPKIAYNNLTKAMIFSNNSFAEDTLTKLTVPYSESEQNKVDISFIETTLSSSLLNYYNQNKDKIAEKKEMGIINSISDLDKIYFAQKGDKVIFGVLERKSDPEASGDPSSKLRYFAVIMYKNIFDDEKVCIELEKTSPLLYCGYKDNIAVIIIPSTPNYEGTEDAVMNYWPDLTAKIRLK